MICLTCLPLFSAHSKSNCSEKIWWAAVSVCCCMSLLLVPYSYHKILSGCVWDFLLRVLHHYHCLNTPFKKTISFFFLLGSMIWQHDLKFLKFASGVKSDLVKRLDKAKKFNVYYSLPFVERQQSWTSITSFQFSPPPGNLTLAIRPVFSNLNSTEIAVRTGRGRKYVVMTLSSSCVLLVWTENCEPFL